MNLIKSKLFLLFVFFCSLSSLASADVIVYSEENQYGRYWHNGTMVKVGYSSRSSHSLAGITPINRQPVTYRAEHKDKFIVVNRVATWWVKSAHGNTSIRITVPVPIYLASWDVRALEKELERLGVKVKSKPENKPVPKPGPVISG